MLFNLSVNEKNRQFFFNFLSLSRFLIMPRTEGKNTKQKQENKEEEFLFSVKVFSSIVLHENLSICLTSHQMFLFRRCTTWRLLIDFW